MKKITVNSWVKLPNGIQVWNFNDENEAFKHAEDEYLPYGYNTAIYSTDLKILVITKN